MTEFVDPYLYPDSDCLRNKLDIRDAKELDGNERWIVAERVRQGVPSGNFDLRHLQAIHRHLFQDVYEWAGEIRTVEISKGGHQFQFRQFIETGMADVHKRIVAADHFKGSAIPEFAEQAGRIIGDVNYVHPFREGNGRTQLLFLKQLGETAGHKLNLRHIEGRPWIEASKRANDADYSLMTTAIRQGLEKTRDQERTRGKLIARDRDQDRGGRGR